MDGCQLRKDTSTLHDSVVGWGVFFSPYSPARDEYLIFIFLFHFFSHVILFLKAVFLNIFLAFFFGFWCFFLSRTFLANILFSIFFC